VAFALAFSSGVLGNGGDEATAGASAAPGASGGTAGGGGTTASAAPSLPAADATITAVNIEYATKAITVPAAKPFTIAFDNQDTVPHDVVIKDAGGTALFTGELVTGPKVVVYDVPALPAGSYTFVCTVHPNMTGTVTAQ
jgi:plastocyanin